MEVERESVKLSLDDEIIKKSYSQSIAAHKHNQQYVVTSIKSSSSSSPLMDTLIIAFKGLFEEGYLYDNDLFGEADVDKDLLPSLQRIGVGQLAKVNNAILQIFQYLLKNSGLKTEVEKAIKENKKILFTGHSFGGAIASFATLWMLDNYARQQKVKLPIGCLTFGSPLIGDKTLTHAIQREKWAGHFTHFVTEHDIVPRIMLAPKTSVQKHIPNILKFLQPKVNPTIQKSSFSNFLKRKSPEKPIDSDNLVKPDEASEFFENVLINASIVASNDAFDLMEPTNLLKEKISVDFIKVSPYRPFGNFVFCTKDENQGSGGPRQLLVVENPNAVLQLLFYFLQLPNEKENLAEFAINSLGENFGYEEELNKNGLQLDNMVYLKKLNQHLLTADGTTGDAVRTSNKALFDLTANAKWCLLAAEESENRKRQNENEIKKHMRKYKSATDQSKIIEDILHDIRKYKKDHENGNTDYYESFKLQNKEDDFVANINRLEMAKIYDVVIEMVMRKDLPDEFETCEEFVDLATEFRRLFEPLDIANYYRHGKGDGSRAYMTVRPKRYIFSQRWYEHVNLMGFELRSESNFVSEIEELLNNKNVDEVKMGFESVKNQVLKWKSDGKIKKDDVFWGEFILSKLQENVSVL